MAAQKRYPDELRERAVKMVFEVRPQRVAPHPMTDVQRDREQVAEVVGAALSHRGRTLAVAESLTRGLLASAFARVPGASEWFRGGSVAHATAGKAQLLHVPHRPVFTQAAAL